jgi:hypothetical protein
MVCADLTAWHTLLVLQVLLAEYGLGAVALYYLTPALLGGFVGSLRGFAGEVTAAQALDLLASDGSAVLIDIRTEVRASLLLIAEAASQPIAVWQWQRCVVRGACTGLKSLFLPDCCAWGTLSCMPQLGSTTAVLRQLPGNECCRHALVLLVMLACLSFPPCSVRRRPAAWLMCLVAARASCWRWSMPSPRTGSCADSCGTHQPLRHR